MMKFVIPILMPLLLVGCFSLSMEFDDDPAPENPVTSKIYDPSLAYIVKSGDTLFTTDSIRKYEYAHKASAKWVYRGVNKYVTINPYTVDVFYTPTKTSIITLTEKNDTLVWNLERDWSEYESGFNPEWVEKEKAKDYTTKVVFEDSVYTKIPKTGYQLSLPVFIVPEYRMLTPFIRMDDGSWTCKVGTGSYATGIKTVVNDQVGRLYTYEFFDKNSDNSSENFVLLEEMDDEPADILPLLREFLAKEEWLEENHSIINTGNGNDTIVVGE